jgi:hypothetical protein
MLRKINTPCSYFGRTVGDGSCKDCVYNLHTSEVHVDCSLISVFERERDKYQAMVKAVEKDIEENFSWE